MLRWNIALVFDVILLAVLLCVYFGFHWTIPSIVIFGASAIIGVGKELIDYAEGR